VSNELIRGMQFVQIMQKTLLIPKILVRQVYVQYDRLAQGVWIFKGETRTTNATEIKATTSQS